MVLIRPHEGEDVPAKFRNDRNDRNESVERVPWFCGLPVYLLSFYLLGTLMGRNLLRILLKFIFGQRRRPS
jgi:hypothetical protein